MLSGPSSSSDDFHVLLIFMLFPIFEQNGFEAIAAIKPCSCQSSLSFLTHTHVLSIAYAQTCITLVSVEFPNRGKRLRFLDNLGPPLKAFRIWNCS